MSDSHTPHVLIEQWLPFEAIGAESQRERGASSALPPLYFLHVWFARRPLTASRAAILGGMLPQWSVDWPEALHQRFPDETSYRAWFLRLLGIKGDPAAARRLIQQAKEQGSARIANPYGSARAFTVNPLAEDLIMMRDLLEYAWGTRDPITMDVTAGGGSIPFEALRYGFTTYANELNPVASVILKATLDYPARFGQSLASDIRKWTRLWSERVHTRLQPYFSALPTEAEGAAYLWARTVACPTTGKPVPLSPNWWLNTDNEKVAVQLIADPHFDHPRFVIKRGTGIDFDPERGTVSDGVGLSPWTGESIDGDYIKAEAQAGRMGQTLYAIAIKRPGGFDFRAPTEDDLNTVRRAETAFAEKLPEWEAVGLVPTEAIDEISNYDRGHRLYGMFFWRDFFTPRQLFSTVVLLEEMQRIAGEMGNDNDLPRARAIQTYLAIAVDKAVIYNTRQSRLDPSRGIRSIFDKHNFAFLWSHAEFDASANLVPWVAGQIADAYEDLANLASSSQYPLWNDEGLSPIARLCISNGNAANLTEIADESIHNITFDPPYYDNVMYAELSDFFYVWLKRSVGHLFPEFFQGELTNKDDEAVTNKARFAAMGRNKGKLAEKDYEHKMEAIFRECYRVLKPEGVLTIMFTHKRVEAWDTLAAALINAGFVVRASWPVHTESEHSLHQAKKNAAASTIFLVCRKRAASTEPVWWDDLRGQVQRMAREKAAEFAAQGVRGVDLYISTFGPALSVISERWPVLTSEIDERGQPRTLRPETALNLARAEVMSLRKQGLLLGREVKFDLPTDWYLMAWDAFKAVEFPYDEARKLAIALGIDLDKEIRDHRRLVARKSGSVVLQMPIQRRKKGMVDPDLSLFETVIDAIHTALLVLEEDGTQACEAFLTRTDLINDSTFRSGVESMINAIPRTKSKGKYVRPEAELLERLRLNFFSDMAVPVESVIDLKAKQSALPLFSDEEAIVDEINEEGDED